MALPRRQFGRWCAVFGVALAGGTVFGLQQTGHLNSAVPRALRSLAAVLEAAPVNIAVADAAAPIRIGAMPVVPRTPAAQQAVRRAAKADRVPTAGKGVTVASHLVAEPIARTAADPNASLLLSSHVALDVLPGIGEPLMPGVPAAAPSLAEAAQPQRPLISAVSADGGGWSDLLRMAAMPEHDGSGSAKDSTRLFGGLSEGEFRARELRCMAIAVYFEARGETLRGQQAVGQVIMNRVKSGYYPATICGVVYQGQWNKNACQFSFACDGDPDTPKDEAMWNVSLKVAKEVIARKVYLAEIADSSHYHATYVKPDWIGGMRRVTRIGVHIFYKAPYVNTQVADAAGNTL